MVRFVLKLTVVLTIINAMVSVDGFKLSTVGEALSRKAGVASASAPRGLSSVFSNKRRNSLCKKMVLDFSKCNDIKYCALLSDGSESDNYSKCQLSSVLCSKPSTSSSTSSIQKLWRTSCDNVKRGVSAMTSNNEMVKFLLSDGSGSRKKASTRRSSSASEDTVNILAMREVDAAENDLARVRGNHQQASQLNTKDYSAPQISHESLRPSSSDTSDLGSKSLDYSSSRRSSTSGLSEYEEDLLDLLISQLMSMADESLESDEASGEISDIELELITYLAESLNLTNEDLLVESLPTLDMLRPDLDVLNRFSRDSNSKAKSDNYGPRYGSRYRKNSGRYVKPGPDHYNKMKRKQRVLLEYKKFLERTLA